MNHLPAASFQLFQAGYQDSHPLEQCGACSASAAFPDVKAQHCTVKTCTCGVPDKNTIMCVPVQLYYTKRRKIKVTVMMKASDGLIVRFDNKR